MKLISAVTFIVLSQVIFAQKKKIDPSMYNEWRSLSSVQISNDGKFISYEINPLKGDGHLYIYHVESGKLDSIPRGKSAGFSGGSRLLVFKIDPGYDTLRNCELNKVDKKKWPKDSLGIYLLGRDSIIRISEVKSFELSEENDWLVYKLQHNKGVEENPKKKKKKKKDDTEVKSDGKLIYLYHPDRESWCSQDVHDFELSRNGNYLAYTKHNKFKCDSVRLSVLNTKDFTRWSLPQTHTSVDKLSFDEGETKLAYLFSDDTSKAKVYTLAVQGLTDFKTIVLIDTTHSAIAHDQAVSINYEPMFTKRGDYLYFGVSERPKEEPKDTLLESEKVKLDIWSHMDQRLQSQQTIERSEDLEKSNRYIYQFNNGKVVQLNNDTLSLVESEDLRGSFLLARSRERYARTYNWDTPRKSDFYRVSVETGEATLLREGARFQVNLSPKGAYYTYFNEEKEQYFLVDIKRGSERCITCEVKNVRWTDDMNGMPMPAYPLGIIGWSEDESRLFVQSEYDVWQWDENTQTLSVLGIGEGAERRIRIRPEKWSEDSVYIDFDNVYFTGFDEGTKGTHLYRYESHGDHMDLRETAYFDATLFGLVRSKNKSTYALRKMTFEEYPDLHIFNGNPRELKRISNTNPQQDEYNWATVELIKWKSYDGIELEGLVYKPEDFDSSKSYPLMVYFYELYSDRLHNYYSPKPTASIIYPTEYASAGYVVFIPDIRYKSGHPGKSAYDCIMSGTDAVLESIPNVDSARMGLQGQSWGGYQTAQLITMTKRYRAAMAGAPVANMFSAYGGIRWGTGINRQFQYERTQSRIGYTIWEKPELYIENSPLFHLPNVETPLLIMHNDQDDAVPWYQGIELFTGLTRLNKEVWMLNYNDDKHNLMKDANRMDLSIRMRQFFDHYLLEQPAPKWMVDGLPAVLKGKEMHYELIEEKEE